MASYICDNILFCWAVLYCDDAVCYNFGKFINFGLDTVRSERVHRNHEAQLTATNIWGQSPEDRLTYLHERAPEQPPSNYKPSSCKYWTLAENERLSVRATYMYNKGVKSVTLNKTLSKRIYGNRLALSLWYQGKSNNYLGSYRTTWVIKCKLFLLVQKGGAWSQAFLA